MMYDFEYVGGDMNNIKPVVGKQAYIEIIKRFSQRFDAMRVKQMIVEGDKAWPMFRGKSIMRIRIMFN